jgi:hypothetical protein
MPERELAIAVLYQAVQDLDLLLSPNKLERKDGERSVAFFRSGEPLAFWCALAGIDETAVLERVSKRLEVQHERKTA